MAPRIKVRHITMIMKASELGHNVRVVVKRRVVGVTTVVGGSISGHVSASRRRLQRRTQGSGRAADGEESQEMEMHCFYTAPPSGAAAVPRTDTCG